MFTTYIFLSFVGFFLGFKSIFLGSALYNAVFYSSKTNYYKLLAVYIYYFMGFFGLFHILGLLLIYNYIKNNDFVDLQFLQFLPSKYANYFEFMNNNEYVNQINTCISRYIISVIDYFGLETLYNDIFDKYFKENNANNAMNETDFMKELDSIIKDKIDLPKTNTELDDFISMLTDIKNMDTGPTINKKRKNKKKKVPLKPPAANFKKN